MRVHVVSDVHGSADALKAAGDGADALVCLGDLVLFVDYDDHTGGIFGDLFGAENAARWVALRTAGQMEGARAYLHSLWAGVEGDPWTHIEAAVRQQYAQLFAAMPDPTYLTYGNVDLPALWPEFLGSAHTVLDGQIAEIGGRIFGFVGGGLRSAYRTPFEISDEEYAAKVDAVFSAAAAIGRRVEVFCAHIPPAVAELTYDVVARRFERGSEQSLAAIRKHQPDLALFGHVHSPLAARLRIGRTECINVGHFRGQERPLVLEW
ncbi:metallophosphoesterase [Sporichthya sp.]|uniref:metallophosphoesterase family protein n=1 Tax=Sporichthya sp. TaxID=65475 RepID=UPI0017A1192E|nr:metallophosphoesterase [Sporichthya sp.]MBA3745546.1 metallophosphoesterase [Sporichthya sp.]